MKWVGMVLLCCLFLPGCGAGSGGGIETKIVDDSGHPIPGARVAVVPMPNGGLNYLEQLVNSNQPLYGWHFIGDSKGRVRLKGIPTGGYDVHVDRSAMAAATAAGILDPQNAGRYSSEVLNSANRNATYIPGEPLGIVVAAPGFITWIGSATFNSPNGRLQSITLSSNSAKFPLLRRDSLQLGLSPLGSGSSTNDQQVSGYYRKDGTYVAPYHRTAPDSSTSNNYSTKGNYDPYTGKTGTKSPTPSRRYKLQ